MKDQLEIILAHCPVWPEGLPRTSKPPSSTCQNSHSWATQRQLAAFQSLHSADQPAGIDFWLDEHMLGLLLCVQCVQYFVAVQEFVKDVKFEVNGEVVTPLFLYRCDR